MAINRINETDLQGKLVSQLSNRPTDPRSAGGDNMTSQQVKARHDALGLLVKDKLNELLDALNNATVNGEPVTPLSDLITVVADGVSKSLTEWIEAKLTKNVTAGEGVHAYGVDDDGEQTMIPVSDAATEGAIPQYGTGGVLPVADGTADGHAMNKGQVDALVAALTDAIAAKYTKPDGGIPLTDLAASVSAIISDALKWSNADTSATPFKVPIRDGTGVVHGATYGASAVGTALVNKEQFEPVKALAEGASQAAAAENYSALVGILSDAPKTKYKAGQRFLIGTYGVPDVGVLSVEDTAVSYTYTTDGAFEASLMAGTLQIGYFVLRPVEGKTNLDGYFTAAETNEAISAAIDLLVDALVDGVISVAEAAYAESATYAQQADFANQINTDREIEDADTACPPVVFGTVGGAAEVQNGLMKFTELRGHTIKWNQLVQNGNFTNTDNWSMNGSGTFTVSNGVASITLDSASRISQQLTRLPLAHKYLVSYSIKLTDTTGYDSVSVRLSDLSNDITHYVSSTTDWQNLAFIDTNNNISGTPYILLRDVRSTKSEIQFKNVQIFDLTDIYGAGNEPPTVAEFVRDFPMPYYPYNAGTLLSSKSSSVDFVKRNQWDEEWELGYLGANTGEETDGSQVISKNFIRILPNTEYYFRADGNIIRFNLYDGNQQYLGAARGAVYKDTSSGTFTTTDDAVYMKFMCATTYGTTYNNDICIYVNWETPGLPYVPYSKQHITLPNIERRSAGSAYDVLYQQGGGKRRIGTCTFTGDENVGENEPGNYYITRSSLDVGQTYSGVANYNIVSDGAFDQLFVNETGAFRFYKSTITSATAMKEYLAGKTIYFELATETDITLEENPGWTEYAEIDNFGTVKFNQDPAQTIPVPQAYFVRYTVNLVEFLDSLYVHCGGDVSKLALVE